MRRSITSILVIISLLFSMTELSNVAVLGYSLMTDGEKASNFCTCISCTHNTVSDTEHCDVDMGQEENQEPKHCNMPHENSGSTVCGCNASAADQIQILFNTLDKTALLPSLQYSAADLKRSIFKPFSVKKATRIQRDIFRPPKA